MYSSCIKTRGECWRLLIGFCGLPLIFWSQKNGGRAAAGSRSQQMSVFRQSPCGQPRNHPASYVRSGRNDYERKRNLDGTARSQRKDDTSVEQVGGGSHRNCVGWCVPSCTG